MTSSPHDHQASRPAHTASADDILHFERQLDRLASAGNTPVALWPAGRYTASLSPRLRDPNGIIACVIDDNPAALGKRFAGFDIDSAAGAIARGVKGVIICAEPRLQDILWNKRHVVRRAGVQLLCCPPRFAPKPWDQTLCDLWDHEQARANGIDAAWTHVYPPADHRLPGSYREHMLAHLSRQLSVQNNDRKPTVLEVGTGHGLATAELIEHAGTYHAVDFSERLLFEIIEHRFANRLDTLHLHHDETASFPRVPDGSVDLAFSFDVFVHLHPDMVHQYLAAFKRVLAPGGRVCLHVRTWDAAEIGTWHAHFRDEYPGRWNGMGYNSIETLTASADHLGLRLERVGDDDGRSLLEGWSGYLVEFAHA